MSLARAYTTRRIGILNALVKVLSKIDGTGEFFSNVNNNVFPRLHFWDDIPEFPALSLNSSTEYRQYQGGGYKDRFLNITIRAYVEEEDSVTALDKLLEDIETVLEENSSLQYFDKRGRTCNTHQISILQIDTDEGMLEPIGVGELSILVHY